MHVAVDGRRCFFFQAEDGIRDYKVTGVQTCALPIWATARDIAERLGLQRLVVVLAPLPEVDRSRRTGVVTVGVRSTGKLGVGVGRGGIVTVRIPVQSPAGPVENPIEGQPRRGGGREQQGAGQTIGIGRAQDQIPVAPQNAHVIAVLVERVLPTALAEDPQQYLLARIMARLTLLR